MATFKEIFDDFMAGKKVRRGYWDSQEYIHLVDGYIRDETGVAHYLPGHDLAVDDWEVVEPTVTITRKQFDEAIFWIDKSNGFYIPEWVRNVLARKLGL